MELEVFDPSALLTVCGVLIAVDTAVLLSVIDFRSLHGRREHRRIYVGLPANAVSLTLAIVMWTVVMAHVHDSVGEMLYSLALMATALAGLQLLQLIILKLDSTRTSLTASPERPVVRWLIYFQRSLMAACGVCIAFSSAASLKTAHSPSVAWHIPFFIVLTGIWYPTGRLVESAIRHRAENESHNHAIAGYSWLRSLYWVPAVSCVVFTSILTIYFFVLTSLQTRPHAPHSSASLYAMSAALIGVGLCFALVELNMSVPTMAMLRSSRLGLVPTKLPKLPKDTAQFDSIDGPFPKETGQVHISNFPRVVNAITPVERLPIRPDDLFESHGLTAIETTNSLWNFDDQNRYQRIARIEAPRHVDASDSMLEDGAWHEYTSAIWKIDDESAYRLSIALDYGDDTGGNVVTGRVINVKGYF